jgi:TolB-like protein/Flp pilus assembly protein TadD
MLGWREIQSEFLIQVPMLAAVTRSRRALAAFLASLAAAGLAFWHVSGRVALDPSQVNTILALPFDDSTEFRELEDYGEAAANTFVTSLGSAEELQMISTTTTAVYKTRLSELDDIRVRTGADSVLDGRLEKAGTKIKLTLRLRNTSGGKTVWTHGFSAAPTDFLASVDRAARELGGRLGKPVRSRPLTAVKDKAAVDFYADARKRIRSEDLAELNRAMTNLAKAQALSPDFAPIPAALVDLYGWATMMDMARRGLARERVETGAKAARAADPDNPEAYFAEGALALAVDWKWSLAERSFQKAVALRPSYSAAWIGLGRTYEALGRPPEALDAMARAWRLDPLSQAATHNYTLALVLNGKYDEALGVLDRYAQVEPDVKRLTIVRALALFGKQDYAGSRSVMRSMLHLMDWKAPVYGVLVPAESRAGNKDEARRMLDELEKMKGDPMLDGVVLASAQFALGEEAKAFASLRGAVENQASAMRTVEGNPLFKDYAKDPRMLAVLKKMRERR